MSGAPPDQAAPGLVRALLAGRLHACVHLDPDGQVTSAEGTPGDFGLAGLAPGERLSRRLEFLRELPGPGASAPVSLPRLELEPGRSVDVHWVREGEGSLLLLVDATADARREQRYQQRGNELALGLRSWGIEVFEERDGRLSGFGTGSSWMRALAGAPDDPGALVEASPFLENFLVDARRAWDGDERLVRSGEWTEVDATGREWPLEASAVRTEDGRNLLMVRSVPEEHLRRLEVLQTARSHDLELAGLHRKVDRKEVLLHCIVHDLLAPLGSIVGSLSLARGGTLGAEQAGAVLDAGLAQARRQETLIRGLLDAFAAELEALEAFETDPARAPELGEVLERALEDHALAYRARGVELELTAGLEDPVRVVGDGPRLLRVLANLLENALRHSTRGQAVLVVTAAEGEDEVRIEVLDRGPGVPSADVDGLFTRFSSGRNSGAAGLGLHFCRRALEIWGGGIGYADRDGGGACFRVRLRRAR